MLTEWLCREPTDHSVVDNIPSFWCDHSMWYRVGGKAEPPDASLGLT